MKFKIHTVKEYYFEPCKELIDLGFRFEKINRMTSPRFEDFRILFPGSIEIDSLEDLVELQKKVKEPIIIEGDEIEIYNDYRE